MAFPSFNPLLVQDSIFYLIPSSMPDRWLGWFKVIFLFLYILARAGVVSRSEIRGSGYLSFLMTLFKPLKSMHSQRLPSFFFTKRTREPHVDLLSHMNPFWMFSLMNSVAAATSNGVSGSIRP